jgi:hypothetical protein
MDRVGEERRTRVGDRVASLLENPWMVVAVLFLATGALGIPLIWMCRRFSTIVKILLTVVVTIYTAFILWLFWLIMVWCYQRIVESM